MILLAVTLCFVGLILGISGLAIIFRKRSYDQCSKPVTATVIYKRTHSAKGGRVFELQFEYSADGKTYKKHIRTSGEDYDMQDVGSKVELLYKPSDPKRAIRPLDEKDAKNGKGLLIVGAAMLVVGVLLFIVM